MEGQVVVGSVRDEDSRRLLAVAEIRLRSADGVIVASGLSDAEGSYRIAAPKPDVYALQVSLLGYRTLESPLVALPAGKVVRADFLLPRAPVELDGLAVEVEAMQRIERQLRGFGVHAEGLGTRFLDSSEIRRRPTASDYGDVLQWRSIPGMSVVHGDDAASSEPFVCVRLVAGRDRCAITVVDGTPVAPSVAYFVPPASIRAIAVLTPAEATLLYGTDGGGGAVLIFTR